MELSARDRVFCLTLKVSTMFFLTLAVLVVAATGLQVPAVNIPWIDIPKLDAPHVDIPKVKIPSTEIPKIDINVTKVEIPKQPFCDCDEQMWQEKTDMVLSIETQKNDILKQLEYLETLPVEFSTPSLMEDATLTTPKLIKKYGYPCESHEIVTEDGYILTYHRIPYGKNSASKTSNSQPLLLQHGLMSSSDDWIITGPEHGLGYILADAGYDVWIANARGNKWSRQHITLDPNMTGFWDFSWHEMGVYDLPAAIDYILQSTGKESLHYIGHSMGTTMFVVMGSERPEYNSKVQTATLLAPAIFFQHNNDVLLPLLTSFIQDLYIVSELFGIQDIMLHNFIYSVIGDNLCKEADVTQILCVAAAKFVGVNTEQLNKTILPGFMAHFPSGSAIKTWLHYVQSIATGEFRKYDHGTAQNMVLYGEEKPPKYNITKVTVPVTVHYAENDGTVMPEDVETFAKLLPRLVNIYKVENTNFKHFDFVIGNDAKELVYEKIAHHTNLSINQDLSYC